MKINNYPLAYGPNKDAGMDKRDEFYDDLTRVLNSISNGREILLMGDLNDRVGKKGDYAVVGQYGEDVVNRNGERIIEMCENCQLKIIQMNSIQFLYKIRLANKLRNVQGDAVDKM